MKPKHKTEELLTPVSLNFMFRDLTAVSLNFMFSETGVSSSSKLLLNIVRQQLVILCGCHLDSCSWS